MIFPWISGVWIIPASESEKEFKIVYTVPRKFVERPSGEKFMTRNWILDQNLDFEQIVVFWANFGFLSKFWIFEQNFDFSEKFRLFRKISIFQKNFNFSAKFWFFGKIWILDQNVEFWQNFRSLTKIPSHFLKIFDLKITACRGTPQTILNSDRKRCALTRSAMIDQISALNLNRFGNYHELVNHRVQLLLHDHVHTK
mgnify:CR=1 FL=1